MEKGGNKKVRTVIEVSPDARKTLKVLAAERGQTMKELMDELADRARAVLPSPNEPTTEYQHGAKPGEILHERR